MEKILIASGPVIVEDGKVILARHENKFGKESFWKFCGGMVEDHNQNLIEAAKKELEKKLKLS